MSENHTTVLAAQRDELEQPVTGEKPAQPEVMEPARTKSRLKAPSFARLNNSSAAVWAGLAVAALGFGTIFFSWIKVAATLDVGRQMPYVVSGAMTGLGLIVIGIAAVDMAVRRQDRLERRHQMAVMRTILEELREVVEPADHGDDRR